MNPEEETCVTEYDLRETKFDKETMILYSGFMEFCKVIRVPDSEYSIEIPTTVHTICNYAFKNTKLDTLKLPYSIKYIGHHAFHSSSIKHIILNDGLEYIGYDAFKECRYLIDINLPSTLIEIGERAFRKCLAVKRFVIPPSVKKIGGGVFAGCKYSTIESHNDDFKVYNKCLFQVSTRTLLTCWSTDEIISIPNGTQTLAKDAFDGMYFLREIYLPSSLISIGDFAFPKGLKTIWVPKEQFERFSTMANGRYSRWMKEY